MTTLVPPPAPLVGPVLDTVAAVRPRPRPVRRIRPQHERRPGRWLPEITVVAVLGLAAYLAFGIWLKQVAEFSIGDALARSADARYMLFARDAHAAAIGVYWMPLPTLSQLPFMAILSPLHHAEYAGPVSTAFWSAGTILVLGRIGRVLGLGRARTVLVACVYAFNPVVIYYGGVGMSEACEFFWVAVVLCGLLRCIRQPEGLAPLIVTAVGLSGLCLTKYEAAVVLAVPVVILVLVRSGRLRKANRQKLVTDLIIVLAPPLACIAFWLLYMRVITGSFTTFIAVADGGQQKQTAESVGLAVVLASHSISGTARFVVRYSLYLGPAIVTAPLILLRRTRQALLDFALLAGAAFLLVVATMWQLYRGAGIGNPRYFTTMILVGTVSVMVVLSARPAETSRFTQSRIRTQAWSLPLTLVLVGVLGLGWATGVHLERSNTKSLETEGPVFSVFEHPSARRVSGKGDNSNAARAAADAMDQRIRPGDHVIADTQYDFQAALITKHLNQWVVRSDRDFDQVSDPIGGGNYHLDWGITVAAGGCTPFTQQQDRVFNLISSEAGQWTKVWGNCFAEIWKRSAAANKGLPYPPQG